LINSLKITSSRPLFYFGKRAPSYQSLCPFRWWLPFIDQRQHLSRCPQS